MEQIPEHTARPINRLDPLNPNGYKRILFIADIHSGSRVSILHPDFVFDPGESTESSIALNPIQKILWDEWMNMVKKVGKVDKVVFVGDGVDGVNKFSEGTGTWSTSMDEQIDNAEMLINEIDFKSIDGVKGSMYHTKDNINCDAELIRRLGGPKIDWDLNLEVEDLNFHVRHVVGTTRSVFMYRPTKIAREMLTLMQNKKKMGEYDFVVRAHVHTEMYLDMIGSMGMAGFTLPCWKGRDDYVKRQINDSADHGWYLFDIDGDRFTRYNKTFHISPEFNVRKVVA